MTEENTIVGTLAEDVVGVTETGEEISMLAGEEVIINLDDTVAGDQPQEDASIPLETVPAPEEPVSDAVNPRDKLHADALTYIISCRLHGVDAVEFLQAKIEEIKD